MVEADSPLSTKPVPRRGFGAFAIVLLLLGGVMLGAAGMFYGLRLLPSLGPFASDTASKDEIAKLAQRLDAADTRLAEMAKSPQAGSAEIAALNARIDSLQQTSAAQFDARLSAVERNAPPPDLAARLARLESTDAGSLMRRAAAALALTDLAQAAETARPFARELQGVALLLPAAPETRDLARYAGHGAPTKADLMTSFGAEADAALVAERRAHADNWLTRLWVNLGELVTIRRVRDIKRLDSEGLLARAGERLKADDLAAAVDAVRALKGPARDRMAPWLEGAQARLAVERDLDALQAGLIATLAQKPDPAQ